MRIPAVREHVMVEGHNDPFLVIGVDQDLGTADLVPLLEGDTVLSVPFSAIRPLHANTYPADAVEAAKRAAP